MQILSDSLTEIRSLVSEIKFSYRFSSFCVHVIHLLHRTLKNEDEIKVVIIFLNALKKKTVITIK
jgi:hypothetical protein